MEEISARKMVDVALEGHEKRILHSDCRWDGTRFACYSNTKLDFNSVDLCFDKQSTNWKALTKRTQAVIVTAATSEAYVVQMWTFLVVLVMFGWPVIKKLNLLTLNLLGAFLDSCYRLSSGLWKLHGILEVASSERSVRVAFAHEQFTTW